MIVLHAVRFCAGFVLRPKIAPSFFSSFPVVHPNIHRLPIELLAARESSVRPEFETSQVEPLAQVIVVGNRMEKPRKILLLTSYYV